MATSGAPTIAPAPAASALPAAPRASIGRLADLSDQYAFADRAYAMNAGFGDAPPDYTFDYGGGQRPWVWRGDDQSTRVAEPLPDGGDRYYYYEPGAQTPYLVRDPDYSYGYDNGALVVIYDRQGRVLPPDYLDHQAEVAGRFLARARAIYQASQQQQREAVAQANWAARRSAIDADRAQWAASQAADEDWRAYHAMHQQQDEAHWGAERYRREAEAARFAQAVNDHQLEAQDWQAARQAQAHAAAAGQLPPPQQNPNRGGGFGFGAKPQPATPRPQAPPQPLANRGGFVPMPHDHQPPRQGLDGSGLQGHPNGPPPTPGMNPALQADAQRRAAAQAAHQAQIQAAAARQAQMDAQRHTQLEARTQAHVQAEAAHQAAASAHQAQIEAQRHAQATSAGQMRAQAQSARLAAGQAARNVHPPQQTIQKPMVAARHETPKPPAGPPSGGKRSGPPHHDGPPNEGR